MASESVGNMALGKRAELEDDSADIVGC